MLGDRAQDARATHALVHALRTHGTTRPKRSVGRPDRCAHVWNGRGGETETSGAATRQVKVCDPRNPRYSVARRLAAAGEFIGDCRECAARRSLCPSTLEQRQVDWAKAAAEITPGDDARHQASADFRRNATDASKVNGGIVLSAGRRKVDKTGVFTPTGLSRYVPRHLLTAGKCENPSARDFEGVAMIVDIAGFTELTEKFAREGVAGAERLSAILDRYFGRMTGIAIAHGGDVLDFAGDAIRVIWQYDTTSNEAALLAVQCGLKLQRALPEIMVETGAQMRQRVSLAEGKLAHLTVGGIGGKWYSLTAGGPVAEAAKANHKGGADDVVVCESLWGKVRGHFDARPLLCGGASITEVRDPVSVPLAPSWELSPPPGMLEGFLGQHFLERMRMGGGRWFGEFRNITALFIGLSGVDCSRDNALNDLQAAVECTQRIHERFGGALTELSEDDKGITLLSVFGLPLMAHEDDAVRAVAAGRALAGAMRERGIAVSMGI